MLLRKLFKFSSIQIALESILVHDQSRRKFFERAIGAAALTSPFAAMAQAPALDASPGVVELMSSSARVAAGIQGGAFKLTIKGVTSQVSSRPAGDKTGDAIVTIDGEEIRIKANSSFNVSASASNLKSANSFWSCFITSMIGLIGAGAWNNIKNNYQAYWNQTSGVWWKRVLQFLQKIFTLPYASYALQALKKCK